jgi:hypothetical protein
MGTPSGAGIGELGERATAGLINHMRNAGVAGPQRDMRDRRTATATCSATASACVNRLPAHTRRREDGEPSGGGYDDPGGRHRSAGGFAPPLPGAHCRRTPAAAGDTCRVSYNKTRWRRAPDRCGVAGSGPRAGSWNGSSAEPTTLVNTFPEGSCIADTEDVSPSSGRGHTAASLRASSAATEPTPPAAAWISTVSPAAMRPAPARAPYAVVRTRGAAPAVRRSRPSRALMRPPPPADRTRGRDGDGAGGLRDGDGNGGGRDGPDAR